MEGGGWGQVLGLESEERDSGESKDGDGGDVGIQEEQLHQFQEDSVSVGPLLVGVLRWSLSRWKQWL